MIHSLRFISLFIFISCSAPLSDIAPNTEQYPSEQSIEQLDNEVQTNRTKLEPPKIQTYKNDEPGWVEVEETRTFSNSISPDKAQQEIMQILRNNAISKKIPETVEIATLLSDVIIESNQVSREQTAWSGFFKSTISGIITAEEILQNDMQALPNKNSYQKTVRLKAYVEPVKGQRDPSFYLDVNIENNLLKSGDELAFSVTPSKDCFIYVFNFMADQNVFFMYPNQYMKENYIKANSTLYIPDESIRDYVAFEVNTLPGESMSTESVYIICTKTEVKPIDNIQLIGTSMPVLSKDSEGFIKLQRWLATIPLNQRVERNLVYHISN